MSTSPNAKPKASLAPELVEVARIFDAEMDHRDPTMAEMRAGYRAGLLAEGSPQNPVSTRDMKVPTRHGEVVVRFYRPPEVEQPPLLVYMHGGGFVVAMRAACAAAAPRRAAAPAMAVPDQPDAGIGSEVELWGPTSRSAMSQLRRAPSRTNCSETPNVRPA